MRPAILNFLLSASFLTGCHPQNGSPGGSSSGHRGKPVLTMGGGPYPSISKSGAFDEACLKARAVGQTWFLMDPENPDYYVECAMNAEGSWVPVPGSKPAKPPLDDPFPKLGNFILPKYDPPPTDMQKLAAEAREVLSKQGGETSPR